MAPRSGRTWVWWMAPSARASGLVLAGLVSSGCALHRPWQGVGRIPPDAALVPVEGVRQHGNECGPAALATLLRAAGDPVPAKEVAAVVQGGAHASLTLDLLLFARRRGHPADFLRGSLGEVAKRIENGQPSMLLLDLRKVVRGRGGPLWHYVVAYGMSRSRKLLYVESGVGKKAMGFRAVEAAWKPSAFWLMHLGDPPRASRGDR